MDDRRAGARSQTGVILLEALIGILIFSLGVLALIGLQSAAVSASADAQYRVEAVNLANQMLSQIWTNVNRATPTSVGPSLQAFNHQIGGDSESCAFAGARSQNAQVTSWINLINTGAADGRGSRALLPGSTFERQQIVVDTAANNRVTITICWQPPSDASIQPPPPPRRHILVANVN